MATRDYDLGIVISPDVGDEQARAIVERLTQAIIAQDGRVVRVNAWGRRRLAYPIEHHRDGLYFFYDLILPPTSVVEVERAIRVNEDIIRHLLVSRDPRAAEQQRQRETEAEARAAEAAEQRAQAEAQAAEQRAQAEVEAAQARAAQAEAAAETAEAPAPEAGPTDEVAAPTATAATAESES